MSIKINLRDFYPWYTWDEFVVVSDEVATELLVDKRYEKSHKQRVRRNKAFYSLDAGDGIETASIMFNANAPESICLALERTCRLCQALNSLPGEQGRRIEAHYIYGLSKAEIARKSGVNEKNVRQSIKRGLRNMKKYFSESSKRVGRINPPDEAGV